MQLHRSLSSLTLALAAALPLAAPMAVQAQFPGAAVQAAGVVTGFSVTPLERLRPGEVLAFRLDGPPAARVRLQLDGASAGLQLDESAPGRYAGEYTIRQGDRLTAASKVTAQVERNGQISTALLGQSLQAGAPSPVASAGSAITAFTVTAPLSVQPGDELLLSLQGRAGGQTSASVQGVSRRIALTEVRPGTYEGSYVVRRSDSLRGAVVADGRLVVDRQESTLRFDAGRHDGPAGNQPVAGCPTCGSVLSVQLVTVKDDHPNVIGTVAGGVLGGVLGRQVGGGTGRDLATIAGAVGGAYAGNRIENNMNKKQVHRVNVKLDDGSTRHFDYAADPGLAVGARVKVENNALARL
jgi:outer membrane lipoprotein SlyB